MITALLVVAAVVLAPLACRCLRARRHGTSAPPVAGRASRRRGSALLAVVGLLALQLLVLTPTASAAGCDVPDPEVPGAGMVGALDPPAESKGTPGSTYQQYSYAGMVWYTYDCDSVIPDASATVDTWVGNELFNVGKNIVGATNSLHYTLLGGDLLKPLDSGIAQATRALYEGPYVQWLWLPLLLLAILVFRHIFSGDMAAISRRGMWALAGLAVAAAAYAAPLFYTHLLDGVLIKGTSQVQGGFLPQIGVDERNALPTALHQQVVQRNWARGEFGQPDGPIAKTYGPRLLDAQALTKQQAARPDQAVIAQKQAAFKQVASELKAKHADGYFTGADGSRTGDGLLAAFEGFAYALFQLLAKTAVLLGQLLMRIVVLAAPLIGFIAVVYHDLLRKVGQAVAAVVLNVVVLAVLAGLHTKLLTMIFDPAGGLSLLTQVLLSTLVTAVFLVVGRPIRRMRQMVELSVGAAGLAVPPAGPRRAWGFLRRRAPAETAPQDLFWEQVRNGEAGTEAGDLAGGSARRRVRPEMSGPIPATAQRLDIRGGLGRVVGSGSAPALPPAHPPGGYPGPAGALPEAGIAAPFRSRVVDAAPVIDRSWDHGDDPVVVPSQVAALRTAPQPGRAELATEPAPRPGPRRAEREMVGGRPVFVLYRPSRGFELRDTDVPGSGTRQGG